MIARAALALALGSAATSAGASDARTRALDAAFASAVTEAVADLAGKAARTQGAAVDREIVKRARRFVASFAVTAERPGADQLEYLLGLSTVVFGGAPARFQCDADVYLSEAQVARMGKPCATVYVEGGSHASYYPGAQSLLLKVLFHPETGKLLGAQAVGRGPVGIGGPIPAHPFGHRGQRLAEVGQQGRVGAAVQQVDRALGQVGEAGRCVHRRGDLAAAAVPGDHHPAAAQLGQGGGHRGGGQPAGGGQRPHRWEAVSRTPAPPGDVRLDRLHQLPCRGGPRPAILC